MDRAISTVFIDNDRTRVTEWKFPPGSETGQHRHDYDYIVVPMVTGQIRVKTSNDETVSNLQVGSPYFRFAGATHNVFSTNDYEFAFIEIELK